MRAEQELIQSAMGFRRFNSGALITGAGNVTFGNSPATSILNPGSVMDVTGLVSLTGGVLQLNSNQSISAFSDGTLAGTGTLYDERFVFMWSEGTVGTSGSGGPTIDAIQGLREWGHV